MTMKYELEIVQNIFIESVVAWIYIKLNENT